MNRLELFNDGWKFAKTSLQENKPDISSYEPVEIPHDWLIYDTENLYENSIGWYAKSYLHNKENKHTFLRFDGVYMDTVLFVNDRKVGEWKYGYSSFQFDINPFLNEGLNKIYLQVKYQSPNSRWYSGAGIYRNVYLLTAKDAYFLPEDIYVSTRRTENSNLWELKINFDGCLQQNHYFTYKLYDQDKQLIKTAIQNPMEKKSLNIVIDSPKLWSFKNPNLYSLETVLTDKDQLTVQSYTQRIGFREFDFSTDSGFYLNGNRHKLNGVCEHHDLGALGSAINEELLRQRLNILKNMGVNAIRTAHNMPAPELMHLTDEIGFLVISEAFDMWRNPKTQFDYARFFDDWVENDVENWIKKSRNHPSLFMWSIGNEINDTHINTDGVETVKKLKNLVDKFDYEGNAPVTFGSNYLPWQNTQLAADELKLVGYNYGEKFYRQHHEMYPDWTIYGSETAAIVQSRGIYHFPYSQSLLADDDEQCSALGNSATSWGLKSFEDGIIGELKHDFSLGQFIWTGFDYIGEPTPYHTKNSYFGQIDTAGFPKDSYFMYQAAWTSHLDNPMVHLFPYWDFNPGQTIDVRVTSNAPIIELFFNNQSLGKRKINWLSKKEMIPTWQIRYEVGELKAVAYNENMEIIATDTQQSFSDTTTLKATVNKTNLIGNGKDILFVDIEAIDANGNKVKNANNRVNVSVDGPARLVGIDNGDSTDYDQYKGMSKRLFSGKLRLFIQSTLTSGDTHIQLNSPGLSTIEVIIPTFKDQLNKYEEQEKYFYYPQNRAIVNGHVDEIPIRKLEIITENNRFELTKEQPHLMVKVNILPKNASYEDIQWRVVDDSGADTDIASISVEGKEVVIKAHGDGQFKVRCQTKNGKTKTNLISELDLTNSGIGIKYRNPYQLISGSTFDESIGEVSNGNERGFATARGEITIIGFKGIDFGDIGSKKIILPIFALSSDEYKIEIWQGKPDEEDSHLLLNDIYQKPSKWNTYQTQEYSLSETIQGVQDIYIRTFDKMHVKGLLFEEFYFGFEKQAILNFDSIYGDSYSITDSQINNIGNNVTIVFNDFNFANKKARQLSITGKANYDHNTIILLFEPDSSDPIRQSLEFSSSGSIKTESFDIEELTNKGTLSFIFLPGSNFDFLEFQFSE